MDVTDWYRIFAWLALAVEIAFVLLLVVRLVGLTTGGAELWAGVRAGLRAQGLPLAAMVAVVATAASLYLSEGGHLVPCRLCWYQRTMMYPLGVILLVAAIRRDWSIRPYAITLALVGAAVSTWHVLIEWNPGLEGSTSCDPTNPCSALPLPRYLHYLSIPTMAGSAFLFVAAVLWFAGPRDPLPLPEEP
ncbi:MAG: disulfide bond formation protein B [Acidimicrobiia bacterium]